jgi:DNA-binding MarR family transcriptional regulator
MNPPYEDCILFLLSKACQRAHGKFKKHLQGYGLTPPQSLVILALNEGDGISAGELARRLTLDYATLSGLLDRMAEAGWILKETADDDRRTLRISLTEKAKGATGSLMAERDAANDEIMACLRPEERLLLKRMLRDLQA